MRGYWAITLVLLVAWAGQSVLAASPPIKLYVDGCEKTFNPPAMEWKGAQRPYVPLRAIAEAMGAKVNWVAASHKVFIRFGKTSAVIKQVQGITLHSHILVPSPLLVSALDITGQWDAKARTLRITATPGGG